MAIRRNRERNQRYDLWWIVACSALAVAGTPAARAQQPQQQQRAALVQPEAAQLFARLPGESGPPEGITADPATGTLFVGTLGNPSALFRLDRNGQITGQLRLPVPLLGVEFNPRDGKVYIAAAGAIAGQPSKIQRVPANFGANAQVEDVALMPNLSMPLSRSERNLDGSQDRIEFGQNGSIPNGLVFRASDGALFISDSNQAAILRIDDPSSAGNICPTGSDCLKLVLRDARLAAVGDPQVGANGISLSPDQRSLFIANTGDDRIFRLDLAGSAGLSLFSDGRLNGPDGTRAGPGNLLFATANQDDEVFALDSRTGEVLAELGAFRGTDARGTLVGLSAPASIAQLGSTLFITNVGTGQPQPRGGQNAAPPSAGFTLSRIQLPSALLQSQR